MFESLPPMDYSLPGSSVHGFSRQEHWGGFPSPPPGNLSDQQSNPHVMSPTLTGRFFTTRANQEVQISYTYTTVQSLSHVQLFATPWTTACQASLSITNSQSLVKLMSIKLVMPSNHLILCRSLLLPPSIFPSMRVFSNKSVLCMGGQSIGDSASASVLPMNIQD